MVDGEESPLVRAFKAHYAELTAFLERKFGNRILAADVTQETYLRIAQADPKADLKNPSAYLFQTAIHLAVDVLRKEKIHTKYVSSDAVPEDICSGAPTPEAILEGKQRVAILLKAVDELPPRCREVFILAKLRGMDYSEIAEKLGISMNMVQKHIQKALIHCHHRLNPPSEPK